MAIKKLLTTTAAFILIVAVANAYPVINYATLSQLASQHWVKISIPADGMYQLTQSELSKMGFSDISKVQIYGYGGHMLSEELTGNEHNDLEQIPTLFTNGKLCFYANGPIEMSFNFDNINDYYYFSRKVNAYSTHGYYLVTEGDNPFRIDSFDWNAAPGAPIHSSSYNSILYEQDKITISKMGKDLYHTSLMDEPFIINYNLPNLSSNSLVIQTGVAVVSTKISGAPYSTINASLITGGQTLPIDYSGTNINPLSGTAKYNYAAPKTQISLPSIESTGQVKVDKVNLSSSSALKLNNCLLDFVLISYEQNNNISYAQDNQLMMYMPLVNKGDIITVGGATDATQVWNLNGPYPICIGHNPNTTSFSSPLSANAARFVAFNPTKELLSITGFEEIKNQNIHGEPTPDFIIVTNKDFLEAAHTLANLHKTTDGIDVLVVTQDEVFNEFSSGTPDAMAVRNMCKMFYDRTPNKLKHLLMMGQATFDNRNLATNKPGTVITFETDMGNNENSCYASDDVFGILDDGSGRAFHAEYIRLGVGRLTPADANEAMTDVKKIAKYITNPDYGPWRNNALIIADQGDENTHIYQAQELSNIMKDEKKVIVEQSKAFIPFFPTAVDEDMLIEENRSSPESNRYVASALCQGQYFASYIGHASATTMTAHSKTWRLSDVNSTAYTHFPIMTTICCDVGRLDSPVRGMAEYMLHKPDGGAIALLTSLREVQASQNDLLHKAFSRAFFTLNSDGTMPTLGYINMKAKCSFGIGGTGNRNKMMFSILGDPTLKVNYPLNRVKVTKINKTVISDNNETVQVSPMQYVDIEANVMNDNGTSKDNAFNGDAYVTLYSSERFYTTTVAPGYSIPLDIHYPRIQLAQIDTKVTNGSIKTRLLIPRDLVADGNLHLSIYAHKSNSDLMVNGIYDNITANNYDASVAITDSEAPTIISMFFDNEAEFAETVSTTANGVLHITATDETALNITSSISGKLRLVLDGGSQSYNLVNDFALISDNGKRIDVTMPFSDLTPGRHTLTFTVMDVAGNATEKSLDFMVEQPINVELDVNEIAATQQATFVVTKNALPELPELTIKVTDVLGNIVWQNTTTSFPCTWNLVGLNGQRVPNGVYRFWATYDDDTYYGGTPKTDLIVIAP